MKDYPVEATERFDDAKFHRKYCMSFVKKFIHGNVLEVGAGCGSFTRDYIDNKMNATLTETDNKNFEDLKKNFINNKNIKISNKTIFEIEDKFDTILYLHVLEHIEDDRKELKEVETKLNKGGHLKSKKMNDILLNKKIVRVYTSKKYHSKNTHGTGCTLSSAIATHLSCGKDLIKSCELGIKYVNDAIRTNLNLGKGNGPINHLNSITLNNKFN